MQTVRFRFIPFVFWRCAMLLWARKADLEHNATTPVARSVLTSRVCKNENRQEGGVACCWHCCFRVFQGGVSRRRRYRSIAQRPIWLSLIQRGLRAHQQTRRWHHRPRSVAQYGRLCLFSVCCAVHISCFVGESLRGSARPLTVSRSLPASDWVRVRSYWWWNGKANGFCWGWDLPSSIRSIANRRLNRRHSP